MHDPRMTRLADVLVNYSTKIKKGDVVAITSNAGALPLVEATYEAVVRAGGHPFWSIRSDILEEILIQQGTDEQIAHLNPIAMHQVSVVDVNISFWADENTKAFSSLDAKRVAARQTARKPIMKKFFDRTAKGEMRWVGTQYPTQASAQDAEMSLRAYEEFVYGAGLLHLDNPAAAWQAIHDRQEHVREYLQTKKEIRFRAPATDNHDGTDLLVNVDPSKSVWINCAGTENFPDGEVFTGPQGADGHVNYTYPAVYNGREVQGVRLTFKGGRVVDASAKKNEQFLFDMLDQDEGARNMGEIAIGTNYAIKQFSRNTLFDEKIGGTFHAACGAGYPESGSNNESGLHWDMVCDLRPDNGHGGGTIEADGEVVHKDGRFVHAGWPGHE